MGNWYSHNLSVRVGFQCLGHSNWTICSLLSRFTEVHHRPLAVLFRPTEHAEINRYDEVRSYRAASALEAPIVTASFPNIQHVKHIL